MKKRGAKLLFMKQRFIFIMRRWSAGPAKRHTGQEDSALLQRQANKTRKVAPRLKENKFLPHTA
ncbi:hypothetical protein S7A_11825 [Pantoea sp. Sc1]|nr:hypothetical protein S7A_11825 [Pantoea sp. Sc1]